MSNLFNDTEGNLTFSQYELSDDWVGGLDAQGRPTLTATVDTLDGVPYELEFQMAANLGAQAYDVALEVYFDGALVGTFTQSGGVFETQSLSIDGIGREAELSFVIAEAEAEDGAPTIDTSGRVASYEKIMDFGGEDVTVQAFAPGQANIYQVLNGQMVIFDPTTSVYEEAETERAFNINAIGYNTQDDLIYGYARQTGVDSLGNPVSNSDLVAIDADGATYRVGQTSYSHYVGDFDDEGNLWTFSGDGSVMVKIDVDQMEDNGYLASEQFTLNTSGINFQDVAYVPAEQAFYGVNRVGSDGLTGSLVRIDVSGAVPLISSVPIVGTDVDGTFKPGVPKTAWGAVMSDVDGQLYVGANAGDHDLDNSTADTGAIYRIVDAPEGYPEGAQVIELLATTTAVGSNDGAMDARAIDPFLGIDSSSTVLLKAPIFSIALAEDDAVVVTSRGVAVLDLLANDDIADDNPATVTHINGVAVSDGDPIAVSGGAVFHADGTVSFTGADLTVNRTESFTYTITDQFGVSDTATVTVLTSPVDGSQGNDHMMYGNRYVDGDGNKIDGNDGPAEVIMGYAGNDKIFAGAGDDAIYGGTGNDHIRAHGGNDLLVGGEGNDLLGGEEGQDTMIGGEGNDAYTVDDLGDVTIEEANEGYDRVRSMVSWTLDDNFEELLLQMGSAALNGTGNALNNKIVGNTLSNVLIGLDGKDRISADAGDDSLVGGAGNDTLSGDGGNDTLEGGDDDDKLFGGRDDDLLIGGDGRDLLRGQHGDDEIYGGDGNDLICPGLGINIAYGGLGNDVFVLNGDVDTVIEEADGGTDTVKVNYDFTLGDNIENLILRKTAVNGTGNGLNNKVIGTAEDNVLRGLDGNDRLDGHNGNDLIDGGDGRDRIKGGAGNDTLMGGSGNDTIEGHAGDNRIEGGLGNDLIYLKSDIDTLVFNAGDGQDVVKHFEAGEDRIELVGMEAGDVTIDAYKSGYKVEYDSGVIILSSALGGPLTLSDFDFV